MSVQMNLKKPHRAADVGRGLVALLGVVALVAGVPVALVAWVGSPLPTEVPALSDVVSALGDTYIPDEFLVKALALVCWLVWIELVASLLVEAVAYARGRKAGAVPLAGGLQRGAARLIAAVALLGAIVATKGVPDPNARPSQSLAGPTQPVITMVIDEGGALPDAPFAPAPAVTVDPAAVPTYQVQRRDTLWDIAERHLGDPLRWQEIFQLNEGCPQADGGCLTDPDLIFAGWQLQLPADAVGLAPPPAPVPAPVAPEGPTTPDATDAPDGPAAPEGTPAPDTPGVAPSGSDESVVLGGGMVLIDDGGDEPLGDDSLDDAVLVSESMPVGAPSPGGAEAGSTSMESPAADGGEQGAVAPPVQAPPAAPAAPAVPAVPPAPALPGAPAVPAAPAAGAEVTVQPGDNLWAMAEAQLATAWGRPPTDAEVVGHWHALVEQNRDRLAPPGDPDLIYPGQVFAAPSSPPDPAGVQSVAPAAPADGSVAAPAPDAPTPVPEAPPPSPDPGDVQVPTTAPDTGAAGAPGTTLPAPQVADDAEAHADGATGPGPEGDGAGEGTTVPPAGDSEGEGPPAGDSEGEGTTAPDDGGGEGTTAPDDGEDRSGAVPVPPPSTSTDPGSGDAPGPDVPTRPGDAAPESAAPASPPAGDAEVQGQSAPVPVGLVGGGVAFAGALLLLERRRRAQQRRRGRGRVVPVPPPNVRTGEQQLRWGADIDGARLLDVALRAAAAGSGATGLPPLRWAEVGDDIAVLVLSSPSPAPPGFVGVHPERWMASAPVVELALSAAHASAPVPTLVPVGTTEHGTELLVDLESSGVVTVVGATDDVVGLLRAVVVAASTAIWSDQPRIVPVGLEPELDRLPGVSGVASLADALGQAEAHAARTEAALRSLRCPSLAQARAAGATPEAWDPLVVVAAVPPGGRDEHRRLEVLAGRPNSAVGLVTVPAIGARLPGRMFVVGDHGWLTIDGVDEPVRPRYLGPHDARTLVDLLDGATGRADVALDDAVVELALRRPAIPRPGQPPPPGPPPPPVAPLVASTGRAPASEAGEAEREPDARQRFDELMADVEVLVRVLGEVEAVRLTGGAETKLVPTRQRALEAISYLSLRESAVDREDLEVSLFPDGANAAKTIYNTVSAARTLLGDSLFPPPAAGRYELSPAVATDYGIFCELVAMADETDAAEAAADLLAEALRLVRGEPFTGVGRGYAWVGPHRGIIVAQVVDAAEELAEVRLATGDWRSAEWAARQGLRAFPSDERMYRLLMRTARAAGNIPGVQRVFRELCDVLADPDLGVEPEDTLHPETIELLEELTGSAQRRRRMGA